MARLNYVVKLFNLQFAEDASLVGLAVGAGFVGFVALEFDELAVDELVAAALVVVPAALSFPVLL